MKSTVAPYATRAHCLRIVAPNGTTARLTDYPRDLLMVGGQLYKTDSGYEFSGLETGTGFSPAVLDLQGVVGVAGLTAATLTDGTWDGARVSLFAVDYLAPVEDYEPLGVAILGKTTLRDARYTAEMMHLIDALNAQVGTTYSPACTKVFGGTEYAGCGVALGPITVTGTLTAVTSARVMRDSSRVEAADTFGMGTIAFTSGANAGLKAQEIKTYAVDGTMTLFEAFPYLPAVGDAYVLIPGCRKRLVADCFGKWNNVPNHGGFPYIPAGSQYAQSGAR